MVGLQWGELEQQHGIKEKLGEAKGRIWEIEIRGDHRKCSLGKGGK